MERNLAPAAAPQPHDPEPGFPELDLIEGAGEAPEDADSVRAELHAVSEPEDPAVERFVEAGAAQETAMEEDDTVVDMEERRHRAAGYGGRQAVSGARTAAARESSASVTTIYKDEEQHKHKGGGGWYLRQLIAKAIAKLEAKSHPSDCECELHDGH